MLGTDTDLHTGPPVHRTIVETEHRQNVEKVFRKLVNNNYMPDFDYLGTQFLFMTVFHKNTYSYCFCRCGYEHEHFDYISSVGKINENMFDNVLKCILDGKCPHTSQVPKEYVNEVTVYGIHVAAAVGTIQAI